MKRSLYFEVAPETWDIAKQFTRKLKFSVFRGQADKKWGLSTSIERAAYQFNAPLVTLWEQEKSILYQFKSRAHHFIQSPPKDDESLEWLALVQHYGGVTRLLDFTDSFYIASFFAMENAMDDACVWAISENHLVRNVLNNYRISPDSSKNYPYNLDPILNFAKSFIDEPKSEDLVIKIKPHRLNERLAIQKGVFLFSCNLERSFENNLCASFKFLFESLKPENATSINTNDIHENFWAEMRVLKIVLPKEWHRDALYDLYTMNIDAASLFPGLEGFARSLKIAIRSMGKPNSSNPSEN